MLVLVYFPRANAFVTQFNICCLCDDYPPTTTTLCVCVRLCVCLRNLALTTGSALVHSFVPVFTLTLFSKSSPAQILLELLLPKLCTHSLDTQTTSTSTSLLFVHVLQIASGSSWPIACSSPWLLRLGGRVSGPLQHGPFTQSLAHTAAGMEKTECCIARCTSHGDRMYFPLV